MRFRALSTLLRLAIVLVLSMAGHDRGTLASLLPGDGITVGRAVLDGDRFRLVTAEDKRIDRAAVTQGGGGSDRGDADEGLVVVERVAQRRSRVRWIHAPERLHHFETQDGIGRRVEELGQRLRGRTVSQHPESPDRPVADLGALGRVPYQPQERVAGLADQLLLAIPLLLCDHGLDRRQLLGRRAGPVQLPGESARPSPVDQGEPLFLRSGVSLEKEIERAASSSANRSGVIASSKSASRFRARSTARSKSAPRSRRKSAGRAKITRDGPCSPL